MGTRPPERPCTSCGQMCRSKNKICMACSTGHTSRYVDGEPVALVGGSWKPVRGVLRWVPDAETVARDELEELRQRTRRGKKPTSGGDLVACPTCLARLSETCKTRGGNPTNPHRERLASRRCVCGDLLAPRKVYCEPCRQRARKNTYRSREVRRATAERRVA